MARFRIGVDVGGTHTDLVSYDVTTGALLVEKVASTPSNPAAGVLNGIANFIRRGIDPAEIDFFAHGTTITTNAPPPITMTAGSSHTRRLTPWAGGFISTHSPYRWMK